MRFDDRVQTVLAADTTPGMGAEAAWRQLVDLLGRGRVVDQTAAIDRLEGLRDQVPAAVRAASARALAFASPPAVLVGLMASDIIAVAAPVLRTASLDAAAWLAMLPRLSPASRGILRHRHDLPASVERGLAVFGPTDFALPGSAEFTPAGVPATSLVEAEPFDETQSSVVLPVTTLTASLPLPRAPLGPTPFMAVGDVARSLPVVAEALRQVDAMPTPDAAPRFEIADLVARLDAFHRDRPIDIPVPDIVSVVTPMPVAFRWSADASGVVRWVEGIPRAVLVGATLTETAPQGIVRTDAVAGGAWRRRDSFRGARLEIAGSSPAAGSWRLAGAPLFDDASGRFTGFAGVGRRPHREEEAVPIAKAETLRQVVHELRTPANAIAGFAELIGTELFGPVPAVYRERAETIVAQAAALIAAIDDLDTAARSDGGALELRVERLALAPRFARLAAELAPIAARRGATLSIAATELSVLADEPVLERLLQRLTATALAASAPGERLIVAAEAAGSNVTMTIGWPANLGGEAAAIDADDGAPLLGLAFTLRIARQVITAIGGTLRIDDGRLTLTLPAGLPGEVAQATGR